MDIHEKRTIELPWAVVCEIISSEIQRITGVQIQCKARVAKDEFWSVEFTNPHLSLPQFCQLVQSTQPDLNDWEDALPNEVRPDIKDMGPYTGERIISRYLHITWEYQVIAEEGLWLVGVVDIPVDCCKSHSTNNRGVLTDEIVQAISEYLRNQEEKYGNQ